MDDDITNNHDFDSTNTQQDLVRVKTGPQDDNNDWTFGRNEVINLLSDDEGDDDMTNPPGLQSPFNPRPRETMPAASDDGIFVPESAPQGTAGPSTAADPIIDAEMTTNEPDNTAARPLDLGHSILTGPAPTTVTGPAPSITDKMLETQRKYAEMFRERLQLPSKPTKDDQLENVQSSPPGPKARGRGKKDAAAARFEKLKAVFDRKNRAKTLSLQEEIEFMKIEAEEQARLRKIQADEEYDRTPSPEPADDDALFVSDQEEQATVPRYSTMISDDETEKPAKKRGRKRASPDDEDDDELQEAAPKRGRPKGSTGANKKARKVGGTNYTDADVNDVLARAKRQKDAKAKKSVSQAKSKAAGRRKAGPTMTNISSMMGNDVFGDTAAVKDLPDQPRFEKSGGRRGDALKALIASVPAESNKKVAASDKRYLDEAIRAFTGHATVRPNEDGNWSVKGMRSTLKHYQIMGTAFMRRRENDGSEPRGGILADQMGLGKTVMMLANIVNGRPKEKVKHRATLIVASPALVSQWAHEIEKHCMNSKEHPKYGIGHVIQYRSGARLASNQNEELLEKADIVLTTYHEVARSYPKAVIPPNLVTSKQKDDWWKEHYEANRGILHRVRFLRIVLDEAQAIKNHRGHTSMACRAVEAKYHWAITGTPIMNTTKEFYPYFKFLREPNTGSYKIFKENFCSPDDPDGSEKLSVFLRKFMIRRTHIDRLFDARLLDLPTPKEHTLWLEFNEVERQIYEIVKKRFIQRINTISKQNGLEKQYSHIWTMILRLRQICGHILLVQGTVTDLLEREDFEKLNRITESEEEMSEEGASLLVHLRNVLKNNRGTKSIEGGVSGAVITENEIVETGLVDVEEAIDQTGGKHGVSFRFRKYLESLMHSDHWDAITQRCLCTGCRQPPKDPHVTSCFHIYCFSCLTDLQHLAARRGHDQARCSECGENYTSVSKCEGLDTFVTRESTRGSPTEAQAKPAKKGKKAKDDAMEDWISMKGEVLPSAKTQAVKAQVMNWLEEDPDAKIIIYSQFIPMIRILGKICNTEQWGFVKYTGEMSHDSRDKAITEFGSDPAKKLMLASLKCGGLGLNLTMASRVICLDPWWNSAVEQQAFCRVFRIGQQKETRMTRFVVKNSIDAAMVQLRERKQLEIDEVMDDSKRKDMPSVDDLMRLFGSVGQDGEGKPFIFAEGNDLYDEGDEHLRLANIDSEDEEQFMGNEE